MEFDLRFFANLFNVTGIGIVMLVSLLVGTSYSHRFFQAWKYAYLCNFGLISLELFAPALGRPFALTVFEAAIIASSAWLFTQTGRLMKARPLPLWTYGVTCAGFAGWAAAMLMLGQPFAMVAASPLLCLTIAYFYLGGMLVARSIRRANERYLAFGWFVILNGLLPISFPVLEPTPYFWAGYWAAGVTHLLVGIGMIVTLLETSKREIQLKNDELRQLDRMKDEFVSTVTHELRTPLTAIKGATWILDQEPLSAQQSQMVRMVASHTDRLTRLIGDVLDYSKLEAGHMRFTLAAGDLRHLVQDAVAGYAPIFAARGLTWRLELATEPMPAMFDADKLTQVIVNLLANALKFTPEGGTVTFRTVREADQVRFEVSDTGPGLPPEELARVFTHFYQVNGGNARPAKGSGLGLAICRAIVEEGHLGRIWAESEPGEGSTFYVSLPVIPAIAPVVGV